MLKFTCAAVGLVLALSATGCSRQQELVMVDPRTGVKVTCILDNTSSLTSIGVTRQAYTCIDELQYYGFRDADTADNASN
jgi:hypothetical protein